MLKIIFLTAAICFSQLAFSQKEISLTDVIKHIGDSVKVCGKVHGGIYLENSKNTPTFLNLGGDYPNHLLTVVIWPAVRTEFPEKPEAFYKDKNVCILGRIEVYKEKPQIVLRNKELLQLSK